MTGVDRVEHAWARHLLAQDVPLFGLVRTRAGFALVGRNGVQGIVERSEGARAMPAPDRPARLAWPRDPRRGAAETALRPDVLRRAPRWAPGRLLHAVPEGVLYLNLGHANLDARVMRAVRGHPGARIAVLVHDVIPLDHPHFARPGTVARFRRKMRAVATHADRVIHTGTAVRQANEAQLARLGRVPPGVTAPLGVPSLVCDPRPVDAPAGPVPRDPWFVAVGTIEPRKNHALLLDLWAHMHATMAQDAIPHLHVVGARGWADRALLQRLDRAPFAGRTLFVHEALPDAARANLVRGARALLFPSLAEGTGLPALEAARDGVPVVCAPLPELRERLGDYPVYADPRDLYTWARIIASLSGEGGAARRERPLALPTWTDHFNAALTPIG